MDKLKAYVVEDERHSRELLIGLLEQHFPDKITLAGSSDSILESVEFLNKQPADILFLDVELSDGQVFDLLNGIDHHRYRLIFITAYSGHAVRAIKFSAADYLLKPLVLPELINAVNKVCARPARENPVLNDFISRRQFGFGDYLVVNSLHSTEKIAMDKISHLEADGIYTIIHHGDKKTISSKPLGVYEEILPSSLFNRCHKSFIVNRYFIRHIDKGRSLLLTLFSGISLPVSARRKELFRRWFRS